MLNKKKKQINELNKELEEKKERYKRAISQNVELAHKLENFNNEEVTIITKDKIITGKFLEEEIRREDFANLGQRITVCQNFEWITRIKPKRIIDKKTGNIKVFEE